MVAQYQRLVEGRGAIGGWQIVNNRRGKLPQGLSCGSFKATRLQVQVTAAGENSYSNEETKQAVVSQGQPE